MTERNEFDQSVGEVVEGWDGAQRPSGQLLTGRTVQMEALSVGHTAALHAAFASAPPSHWSYMPWGPFEVLADYWMWVDASIRHDGVEYMTICGGNGEPVGVAGYMAIEPAMGSIEVGGITYAPSLQGTVEATEAMYLMMAHAFDDLGFRRYEWKCDAANAPSRSAAERLGFVYEGTFAQHRVVRGRNRDTAWFGLTDHRWRDEVKPSLQAWLKPSNFDEDGGQRERLQTFRSK